MLRCSAVLVLLAGIGALAAAASAPRLEERIAAELAAVEKTRALVSEKLEGREGDLRSRVRSLYKLTRGGLAPLWVDERARVDLVHRRAAAFRMILRDLEERKLLLDELANADQGEARLRAEAAGLALAAAPPIPAHSLTRPVPGRVLARFGEYKDPSTKARLLRRGVELKARGGDPIVAAADGQISWVGPLRGLGTTVVVRHQGYVTVVAGLGRTAVKAGDPVLRGAPLGDPAGDRVTFEVRRGGRPVDPEPLLALR